MISTVDRRLILADFIIELKDSPRRFAAGAALRVDETP
jgi:hypothetical protein